MHAHMSPIFSRHRSKQNCFSAKHASKQASKQATPRHKPRNNAIASKRNKFKKKKQTQRRKPTHALMFVVLIFFPF
jgi:hypothetical protein